ncbi:MAG: asparagine synthase (glutamine-hydrolyzing) [Rhodospirillales bacterium]|nr:asparagine synthase (glutamine-hydrolyzing) [Rhodospirillales bacterium]
MCGIGGLYLPRAAPVAEANLDAMATVMDHRGPDGRGRFVSPNRRYQGVFTRLAIIDLDTGDQPIEAADGKRVLMGNGEIYNYVELRREAQDYPFKTRGDMEVVLALAARLGDDFVHRLNGMYALALYDARHHRLLLVRDRLGVKPLYWARLAGGGVLFASEIKAIFASGLISPAIDEGAVSSYLAHGYVPAPDTLFRGVNKLAPGSLLSVDDSGAIAIERYWRAGIADDLPQDPSNVEDHLRDLLRDSLRLQLRSDVPVGALLSGGLDSGLMVALAAQLTDKPINTYTVRFAGAAVDEAPLAGAVAERYGTRHTVLDVDADRVGELLPKLAWYCEEPLNDAALLPNYLIESELGGHVKVALNGTGGDELFAGYGRYFRLPVERRYLGLPGWLRRGVIEPAMDRFAPMTAWKLRRAAKMDSDGGAYLHDHCCHFPPPMRTLIGNPLTPPEPAQSKPYGAFPGPTQTAALYADLNTYLSDDLLTLLDRTSMAASVEGRVPFLDHRLVEAALAVPPEARTPDGRQKGLQRAIARPLLPAAVLEAPKQGFASPVPAWLAAGLEPLARRILTRPETLERGWWTKAGVEHLLARPRAHGFRVYTLLMLELALRVHVEGPPSTTPPDVSLEALADAA